LQKKEVMKAMVLTGIRQMEMQEWPEPMIINETDVKIKMKRLGVVAVMYITIRQDELVPR